MGFIQAHGGIVSVVLTTLMLANVILSAISQGLRILHQNVPGWIGTVAGSLAKGIDILSANPAHPVAPAATPEQPKT